MTRPTLIVLLGPHGAGKTTIGRALAHALGWRFDEEIGGRFRHWCLRRDPAAIAQTPQPAFDRRVCEAELRRDARSTTIPRIVETWHPGNLAYAEARSPDVARALASTLQAASIHLANRLFIQPLTLSPAASSSRTTQPGDVDVVPWFRHVGARAIEIATSWGLPCGNPISTDDSLPALTAAAILRIIPP